MDSGDLTDKILWQSVYSVDATEIDARKAPAPTTAFFKDRTDEEANYDEVSLPMLHLIVLADTNTMAAFAELRWNIRTYTSLVPTRSGKKEVVPIEIKVAKCGKDCTVTVRHSAYTYLTTDDTYDVK